MIHVNIDSPDRGFELDQSLDRISDTLAAGCDLLWVDVVAPTADELRLIGEEFAFHPLALEDAARPHQRPKLDPYDGFFFLVFYALCTKDGRPRPSEINLFVGKSYLVTVHHDAIPELEETARRWRQNVAQVGDRGVGLLVYSLLDAVVDGYFPVVDDLSDRIDDLESAIFDHSDPNAQETIFALKKDLLAVRRVLAPERDVMNLLVRRESPIFGEPNLVYFQDVYDHILRVTDAVDTYRDLLSSALDASLSITSNRLNRNMKTLTASSIILMSMTLIAGIYGMNFVHMPELGWLFGYPWALGLMAVSGRGCSPSSAATTGSNRPGAGHSGRGKGFRCSPPRDRQRRNWSVARGDGSPGPYAAAADGGSPRSTGQREWARGGFGDRRARWPRQASSGSTSSVPGGRDWVESLSGPAQERGAPSSVAAASQRAASAVHSGNTS